MIICSRYAVLIALSVIFMLPIVWMIATSLKSNTDTLTDLGFIPENATLDNYRTLFGNDAIAPIGAWFKNSLLTALIGTSVSLLLAASSGYAFARFSFPGKRVLFGGLIASLLLPGIILLIPQFLLVSDLGLYNSIAGFFLPGAASAFGVFFMRQFFLGFPTDLEEAAELDGAGPWVIFRSIVLPLCRPALATLALISFLAYWNDYLWPLVNCEGAGCTLTAGLANFQGQYALNFGVLMAGSVLASVPTVAVFLVAQKWIVRSITFYGLKG